AVASKGDSANDAVALEEPRHFGVPQQAKRRKRRCATRDELEKIPLRHERDERELCRQPLQRQHERLPCRRLQLHARDAAMRKLEKLVGVSQLVHQLQRRGMNGIAAEIPQEIAVLLEYHDLDAGASE